MTAKPIILGATTFAARKDVREYLSTMLAAVPHNDRVPDDLDGVLRDLVQYHPDAERKVGVGIDGFTVRFMPPNSSAFFIERVDGTREDFSFHKCMAHLSGAGFREREVKAKLRDSVKDDIEAFRATLPDVTECALTGASLRRNAAHIDHAFPNTFTRIIDRFMVSERQTWATFPIGYSGDPMFGRIITDRPLARRWQAFHRDLAHLRPVHPDINSKIGETDPAEHPAVIVPFLTWMEDNLTLCRSVTGKTKRRKQREYMLSRIREVFYGHPDFVDRIARGHTWLIAHGEPDELQERWFGWLRSHNQEAA